MVVVVLAISFLGDIALWTGDDTILAFGLSIASVIAALTWFLSLSTPSMRGMRRRLGSRKPKRQTTLMGADVWRQQQVLSQLGRIG